MKLWSQNIKTKILVKKVKLFQKNQSVLSHTSLEVNVLKWSSPFLLQIYSKNNIPMFYSNSNVDKNYVI
jgi:hypothetical protein